MPLLAATSNTICCCCFYKTDKMTIHFWVKFEMFIKLKNVPTNNRSQKHLGKNIQIASGLIILFSNISRSELTTVFQGTVQELAAYVRISLLVISRLVSAGTMARNMWKIFPLIHSKKPLTRENWDKISVYFSILSDVFLREWEEIFSTYSGP